ncbi:hypothetical protein C8J56DRAFT_898680 [Mycena floridula]|nr:hypothetical protein C8J56DRAFT_898680 [Mycena floridula]
MSRAPIQQLLCIFVVNGLAGLGAASLDARPSLSGTVSQQLDYLEEQAKREQKLACLPELERKFAHIQRWIAIGGLFSRRLSDNISATEILPSQGISILGCTEYDCCFGLDALFGS